MAAPVSYTHPSHIASGYRPSPDYDEDYCPSRKHYTPIDDYPRHTLDSRSQYPPPEDYSRHRPDYHKHRPRQLPETRKVQLPVEDYAVYTRHSVKLPPADSACSSSVEDLREVQVRQPDTAYRRIPPEPLRGVAVQDGTPQVLVVASQRDGSTHTHAHTHTHSLDPQDLPSAGGCCRAALPLLLVLLLTGFLILSGFLFYFNIVTYNPDSSNEGLCEDVQCAYGGICMAEAEGQAVCRCLADCPAVDAPVCGSDGHTYHNLCALRLHSCSHRLTVVVQRSGPCEPADPCENHSCPAGAQCLSGPDGSARCECPEDCPAAILAPGPVCGTDNRDYRDQCDMYQHACQRGLAVSVKYEGPCDPCVGLVCPAPQVCQLDEERRAGCHCAESCAEDLDPVCGSDGYTYANECFLQLQACRDKKVLRVVYKGACSSGSDPCSSLECRLGEECSVTRFGIARCECVSHCEPVVRQVCGSDGRTYDSACHLRKTACLDRVELDILYSGPCDGEKTCVDVECERGMLCQVVGGGPECVCPTCHLHHNPVCGSDGHTYNNHCTLRATNCLNDTVIESVHEGVCDGCDAKTCDYFSACETDKDGTAQCVCVQNCPKNDTSIPVCGNDGNTYESICALRKYVCETRLPVELDYEGDCKVCLDVHCHHGARCRAGVCVCPLTCPEGPAEPVCASDLHTYKSECHMLLQACATDPLNLLTVLFFGACSVKYKTNRTSEAVSVSSGVVGVGMRHPCQDLRCEHGATCTLGEDGGPHCACLLDCSSAAPGPGPICGSDLQLHDNTCAMRLEACRSQREIRLRPLDLCRGMEVKPCNGGAAVADTETGQALDCGSGPNRRDCPLDSYCHQTPHFARCCPKESGVYLKSCQDSWYGCCPDKKTPARGPQHLGCPSLCGCNKIGSYSEACVGDSEQCHCRPGVGGLKCDRCEPGYWGLPKITSGYQGCLPCSCSAVGSVREDCEQMTGRCVCKPGVQGHKCDVCVDSSHALTTIGCTSEGESMPSSQCQDFPCEFGASCADSADGPHCVCSQTCPEDDLQEMVCGTDGKLYASKCQLKLFVCQIQSLIDVQDMRFCIDDEISETEEPMNQWTLDKIVPQPQEIRSHTNHFNLQLVEIRENALNRIKGPSLKVD